MVLSYTILSLSFTKKKQSDILCTTTTPLNVNGYRSIYIAGDDKYELQSKNDFW